MRNLGQRSGRPFPFPNEDLPSTPYTDHSKRQIRHIRKKENESILQEGR